MEDESSLGQPIPTAVLTGTKIISATDPGQEPPTSEAPFETSAVSLFPQLIAELILAPLSFWACIYASYFRFPDTAEGESSVGTRRIEQVSPHGVARVS